MTELLDPSLLPQQATLFTVWLLGASLGLTACTATCLPFMGTWVLGRGGSQLQALRDTALFVSGRILAYTLLVQCWRQAVWLSEAMNGGTGNAVIGLTSIAAGVVAAW
jgi:thiol:disulfide interchange protein DsbD